MKMLTTATALAEIAVLHPGASRVLHQHRLDFCCGGRRSLADACRERAIDPSAVLAEIAASARPADAVRWDEQPLPALVAFIVDHWHRRLRESFPELIGLARRVEQRHGGTTGCPLGLAAKLEDMHLSVLEHLHKEEESVFPLLVSQAGCGLAARVHVLELEHESHREDLLALRRLTDDLTPPPAACTTWRALYAGLQGLEQELMEHIHLENNVLFRRALVA